jgi:hypothetical protein
MKKFFLIAAAVASIAATAPAAAQVAVGVGPGGASVRVGEPHRGYDRGYHRDRYAYRSHCRTERVTIEGRHGRTIVKTRRICD